MARDKREAPELDRELAHLPPALRWREWMRRIEAVLFSSATPVAREDLARVVGQGAAVDLLIEDLGTDLEGRPYEVARVGAGWMLRTKSAYAPDQDRCRGRPAVSGPERLRPRSAGRHRLAPADQPRRAEGHLRK